MTEQIKPIPTRYAGCLFRSRLEARWAVFFDHMGIRWEYESQGYFVGFGSDGWTKHRYLPDFWLPETQTWVEVKGSADNVDWQLLAEAVDWGSGLPYTKDSADTLRGLLLLGPIPRFGEVRTDVRQPVHHPILQHRKGGEVNLACFQDCGLDVESFGGTSYFDSSWGSQANESWVTFVRDWLPGCYLSDRFLSVSRLRRTQRAYTAARSARFEHGQWGAS